MKKDIENLKRYRVGVLAGGPSNEREISLKSGNAVFNALKGSGLDAVLIDADENEFSKKVDSSKINAAFIALHGRFGEDGTVQRMLEEKRIPYTGSGPESSRLALDKLASKEAFRKAGLHVPRHKVLPRGEDFSKLEISFPCVVKPRYEGSSIGLSVVQDENDMHKAIDEASEFGEEVIIEEFIPGREITVGVLDGKALPVIEIVPAEGVYDFSAKYHSKCTQYIAPAKLEEKAYSASQEAGLKAHLALGCRGFSRVDIRLSSEGKPFILEVNTIPGLTERSLLPMAAKAAGLDFPGLCVKMLLGAISKKEEA